MNLTAVSITEGKRILGIRWPRTVVCAALVVLLTSSLTPAQTRFVDKGTTCIDRNGSEKCRGCPKGAPTCVSRGGPFGWVGEATRLNYKDGDGQPMPPGVTLVVRGGAYPEPIILNKSMEIRADGMVTIGPVALADFDLVADTVDPNGLPLNPKWGALWKLPPTLPNPLKCPPGRAADAGDPGSPACTNQFTYVNKGLGCGPHVNWFGATLEGTVCWDGYSDVFHSSGIFGFLTERDKDYNINLRTSHDTLQTTTSSLVHCEFRGPDTVDHFFGPAWWSDFRLFVESDRDDDARRMIDGSSAIMTGLVSLDCVDRDHACASELHPLWALAMNVQPQRDDDRWEVFVSNQGVGGSCIGDIDQELIDFPNNQYTLRLPWRDGATSVKVVVDLHPFKTRKGFSVVVRKEVGGGVFLTFPLEAPGDGAMWFGEVRLQWTGPNITVHPRVPCR